MDDKEQDLVCRDCGKTFTFTQADVSYFQRRGWPIPPATCRGCRTQPRRQDASRPRPDAQPAYATGDPNEYRSPMDCAYPTAPRVRDMRPTRTVAADGAAAEEDDVWARDPNSIGDPNEYRSPMQGGEPSRGGGGGRRRFGRRPGLADDVRAHAYRRQVVGDSNEYRSPMGGQLPAGGETRAVRAAPSSASEGGERRARRRRPRTLFDAVCAKCGAAAQVPFEPTAGRDVYCKACFDERRGAVSDRAVDGSDA